MITIELSDYDATLLVDLLVNPGKSARGAILVDLVAGENGRLAKIIASQLDECGIVGMAADGSVLRRKA